MMKKMIIAALAAAPIALASLIPVTLATPAHADPFPLPPDPHLYLVSLNADGISYSSPQHAIDAGFSICHAIDDGTSPVRLLNAMDGRTDAYSRDDLRVIIREAVAFLCPQDTLEVPESWD